ncbi:MAG: hypothetical protein VX826_01120 [Candidatus Neomarinimicrobiota bacterium]|jgi:hypothetical protein|nr:hypothetical protein [Candidatus Neomarinimicrobiota bacterium]MEE3138968.1 hypothetical protein [Candidatus Neomarinimicrobiota bacterium]|tara:strand:+ start:497 stop:787 length:291 start_codon:yes stop_codon:yes gene_type:complete
MRLKEINKKYEELVNDFIELSDKLNVKIVHDKGDFNGDNCLLFSDNFIVINKHKPLEQRVNILAKCFGKMNLDNIYIKPVLRELIDKVKLENEYVT